jgi:hypothetical protein
MKISVNDTELYTLSQTQLDVLANDIPKEELEADIKRRIEWVIIDKKYKACFGRLKSEWDKKLAANGVQSIPLDEEAYAQLVFAQPNYRDRSQREAEALAAQQAISGE